MTRTGTIVCFGEALIDFLAQPPQTADSPRAFLQFAGGAPANVAVAVAHLGGDTQFVGMLGADMFGDFLLDSLHGAGVGTDFVVRTEQAKTALAFVALDADGERSFSFYRPPSADLLFRAEHYAPTCFDGAAAFHVCSNSLTETGIAHATLAGMGRAHEAGALVSMDLNLRPALWAQDVDPHPRLWDALQAADLVKLARSELEYLAAPSGGDEEAVLARLWRGRTQIVVVTDGAAPVRWYTRASAGDVPSFDVRAVDTTAAGDAFVGGLLFRLARHGIDGAHLPGFLSDTAALADALRFAAAAGGLAVTRNGAFAAMPRLSDVQALLEARSNEHA
ncbi:carbohydrate kinase [Luteimonas sp. SX5]|uniref:Carbohydrate kinase n=1 Tax=Luteimonas galliterrae TaxID=2940486 RepID=A0ABT0MFR4_9GAMM|nr:carbohydrate kinase [Luteimonas galliterrae]MCL1633714.1 carbohydrate kinase [Luteimonas galliterrae]